jgi:hypothetical protein
MNQSSSKKEYIHIETVLSHKNAMIHLSCINTQPMNNKAWLALGGEVSVVQIEEKPL